MKTTLKSTDINGKTVAKNTKIFEICLEHEPTPNEICQFQNEAAQWQNLRLIKLYPAGIHTEKMYGGKFWTLTFEVHQDDWLFWCGFCAGKKWGVLNYRQGDIRKKRMQEIGEWSVQI